MSENANVVMSGPIIPQPKITVILCFVLKYQANIALGELNSGIEQVNQAITIMDEVTQQNTVLVEQAAALLEDQAAGLFSSIAVFKLEQIQALQKKLNPNRW